MRIKLRSIRKYPFPNNCTSPRRSCAFRVGLCAGKWLEWKGNKDILSHKQAIIRFYKKNYGNEFAESTKHIIMTTKCLCEIEK